MSQKLPAFKAYDVRGKIPEELNEELVYKIGLAYANEVQPKGKVATGRDIRDSSPVLQEALNRGLMDGGADVIDAGLCGTETIYFASSREGMGGGLMVTASHNPKGYNGVKPVGKDGIPLTGGQGLQALENRILNNDLKTSSQKGSLESYDYLEDLKNRMLELVPPEELADIKIVANPGNGCAGPTAKAIADACNLNVHWVHFDPDQDFPNGIPNPLLPENRKSTADAVISENAEIGFAWDGDFDRCFFFDGKGEFVEGYYLVGLLAEATLKSHPGACIIHDPRLFWNTEDIVSKLGGKIQMSRTGHAFIKEVMRKSDAHYGGEMSAHHYFKEFSYCDSGMLPWLNVLKNIKSSGQSLAELVGERQILFPCSGEINFRVENTKRIIENIISKYQSQASREDRTDGVSFEFNQEWRFNLRASNTEPLLRLNLETRGNHDLMVEKTEELKKEIQS